MKYPSKSQEWLVKYKTVHNCVVAKIHTAKQAFFQKLFKQKLSPKKLRSALRSLKPHKFSLSTTLSTSSITVTSTVDKANLLNNCFASCFNPADGCLFYDPVSVPESSHLIWILHLTRQGSSCLEHTLTLPLVLISSLIEC